MSGVNHSLIIQRILVSTSRFIRNCPDLVEEMGGIHPFSFLVRAIPGEMAGLVDSTKRVNSLIPSSQEVTRPPKIQLCYTIRCVEQCHANLFFSFALHKEVYLNCCNYPYFSFPRFLHLRQAVYACLSAPGCLPPHFGSGAAVAVCRKPQGKCYA
jgi:hypothetical protein